ncbi:MAG: IS1 family transposase [Moraxella sp.]|nr:IS1 family transposase [Moraxella sp.]
MVKAGFAYGKQRYRCKDCKHHFTVLYKSTKKDENIRKLAIDMYLKGLGFRAIGRVLGIGHSTVYYWVKELGIKHESAYNTNLDHNNEPIDVVELDEIHSYSKFKKHTCWTWIAIDRQTKHLLGFVCGRRDTKTFQRLYHQLNIDNINLFCSDYWKVCQEVIPTHKHLQSKAQTFTVEGYNSRIRHYLARFKCKTKCYSKCQKMIEHSLTLLFAKWNGRLSYV